MSNKPPIRKTKHMEKIQGTNSQGGDVHQINQESKVGFQKPNTVDTGKAFYPPAREFPKIVAKFGELLDSNQYEGVNRVLDSFSSNPSQRVLLADGTGIGKTMQLLAIGWGRAKKTGLPSLVVTKNETLLQTMREDAKQSNISSKRVHFTSYEYLKHTLECNNYSVILFDEAHELTNYNHDWLSDATKEGVVLASATSFSSPSNCVKLLSIVNQQSPEKTASKLKLDISDIETYKPLEENTWEDVTNQLKKEKEAMMFKGTCIQRYLEFQGDAKWSEVPDSSKTPVLAKYLKEIIACEFEEGRKVIIYSSKKEELLEELKELQPVEFEKFKAGKGNLIILEPNKDSEGLRLHDKSGRHPRTVIVTEPLDVEDLIQIQGRAHRRNAKSVSKILGIYDPLNGVHAENMESLLAQSLFLTEQAEFCPALGEAVITDYAKNFEQSLESSDVAI